MRARENTVFIVDDDASVRDALSLSLGLHGYPVLVFGDAESLLGAYRPEWRGCLLIDIRMPGMNGLALQRRLLDLGCRIPAIIMTGHGDIDAARDAFRAQAIDFLEKPIDPQRLMTALEEAFASQAKESESEERLAAFQHLLASLTAREREVMDLVVSGRHNRDIAAYLGISARTVEVHKAHLQAKLRVENLPDLVRLSLLADHPKRQ
jgi:FixJ family two-component response regulator